MASFLYVGMRRPDGSDPVLTVNGQAILSDPVFVLGPRHMTMERTVARDFLTFSMDIPDIPALAGEVVLFQLVVLGGSQAITSDVFGTKIYPAAQATASRSSAQRMTFAEKTKALRAATSSYAASAATRFTVTRQVMKSILKRSK
ncbi:MAG: hypothetical protein CSA62_14590 [Planctomycetota bacterium]|nr:MAG: hypothetical protein CSA62_14590 [Planctomycetota bacterium]